MPVVTRSRRATSSRTASWARSVVSLASRARGARATRVAPSPRRRLRRPSRFSARGAAARSSMGRPTLAAGAPQSLLVSSGLLAFLRSGLAVGRVEAGRLETATAGADQGVGGDVVALVPAAADLVEPPGAGPVAGDVQVRLERLDVQDRGAVEQVDPGEGDRGAGDGQDPDQAEGEVVGADRGAGGEHPDPLARGLEPERDRPEPGAGERRAGPRPAPPNPVQEADQGGGGNPPRPGR